MDKKAAAKISIGIFAISLMVLTLLFLLMSARQIGASTDFRNFSLGSGHGFIYLSGNNYTEVHDNSSGGYAAYGESADFVGQFYPGDTYIIYRNFLPFDTSSVPNGAIINSAKLYFYIQENDLQAADDFCVITTTQESTSSIVISDYDKVGTQIEDCINLDINDSGYSSITLTNLSWVNKTGYTKIGLRASKDISGTAPETGEYFIFKTNSGENQAYLEVDYDDDITAPIASFGENPVDNYNDTDGSITFDFKCSDNVNVSYIQLWGDWAGTWEANYTNSDYENDTWLNITRTISDGTYSWAVYCNDTNSLTNMTANRTFTVDATPPIIDILSPSNGTVETSSIWFNVTLNEPGSWCGYSLDSASNKTMTNSTGNWNDLNDSMTEGLHDVIFYCNDTLGNMASSSLRNFTIDITAPTASFGINPLNNSISNSTNITFDFKCSDNYNVSTVQLWINTSGDWQADYTNSDYENDTWLNITRTISDGTYSWAVYCNDSAGGSDWTDVNRTFRIDSTEPIIELNGPDSGDYYQDAVNIVFNFTATDNINENLNCSLHVYSPNSSQYNWIGEIAENNTPYTIEINTSTFTEDGIYEWNINCSDGLNIGESDILNFTLDTDIPDLLLIIPINNNEFSVGTSSVTFEWNVTDNLDSNISCQIYTKSAYQNVKYCENSSNCNQTISGFSSGSYSWRVNCSDRINQNISGPRSFSIKKSRGGGGGGGTTLANETNQTNQTVQNQNDTQPDSTQNGNTNNNVETISGLTLREREKAAFIYNNQEHIIEVLDLKLDSVTIKISSEPLIMVLSVGEVKNIDVDGDNEEDISITLEKIENGNAIFKINYLAKQDASQNQEKINENWLWLGIYILVVFIFALVITIIVLTRAKEPRRR
jgi:hypothetical protein